MAVALNERKNIMPTQVTKPNTFQNEEEFSTEAGAVAAERRVNSPLHVVSSNPPSNGRPLTAPESGMGNTLHFGGSTHTSLNGHFSSWTHNAGTNALPRAASSTQKSEERRANAKLDYYKKLAELQQMNLEFGRNIREAQQQVRQTQESAASANAASNENPAHPLSAAAFHVATKHGGTTANQKKGHSTLLDAPSLPKPLPSYERERITAALDINRLAELQRRYDEVQQQRLAHAEPQVQAPLLETHVSIEDRLAQRVAPPPPQAPRLPLRGHVAEERKLTPVQPYATPETSLQRPLSDLERRVQRNPAAFYNNQQPQALQRQVVDALVPQQAAPLAEPLAEIAPERIREVLLDPTRIDPHLISLSDLNPRAAKYYDQVAVSLISISYKRLLKRVLLASALHGEGRTSVALNLAGALARARQRVLVVDCDLLNPSVLRLLGLDAPIGLSEAVQRGLAPNAAALRVQPAAFNLLPVREKLSHSAELLASPRFHELIQLCEADYDFILFDSSPLLESPDANLLSGLTDATLMVIRPGYASTQQMAKAVSLFNEKDICGVVLNRVNG